MFLGLLWFMNMGGKLNLIADSESEINSRSSPCTDAILSCLQTDRLESSQIWRRAGQILGGIWETAQTEFASRPLGSSALGNRRVLRVDSTSIQSIQTTNYESVISIEDRIPANL